MNRTAKVVSAIAGAVVLTAGGVGIGLSLSEGRQERSSAGSPAQSQPADQGQAADSKKVTALSGGTGMAPDGETRIGFPSTCEGAAMAAANYAGSSPFTKAVDGMRQAVFAKGADPEVIDDNIIEPGSDPSLLEDDSEIDVVNGRYKIKSCTPGQSAEVHIFLCDQWPEDQVEDGELDYFCVSLGWTLQWEESDWKWLDTPDPATIQQVDKLDKVPEHLPLSKQDREYLFSNLDGWKDFDDAQS